MWVIYEAFWKPFLIELVRKQKDCLRNDKIRWENLCRKIEKWWKGKFDWTAWEEITGVKIVCKCVISKGFGTFKRGTGG